MSKAIFLGIAEGGHFVPDRREWMTKYLLTNEGKKMSVVLDRFHARRSLKQNAYVHAGVFEPIQEYCGYETLEEAKIAVKHALGYYTVNEAGMITYTKTSEMNKVEMGEFIEKIRVWALTFLHLNIMSADEFKLLHPEKYGEGYG